MFSLSFFVLKFADYKNKFGSVYKILRSKMERVKTEEITFEIN
jgi:hypothetical protein